MQDFTGVPCVVDLATMREAITDLGGDPAKINPLAPAELVIDHSVIADKFGTADAFARNVELEYGRNRERYQFLRWGQTAFDDFKVVPPGTGIVHQVNIEHLARVIFPRDVDGVDQAYPDTCVGTDSHTTMVNGLGVLGWGVGGIEAEAAMLGQPVSMLIPRVVGFKLTGELPEGTTATDLVLTITEMLRKHEVVGKFVEFYGEGVAAGAAGQPRHHRQHDPGVRLHRRHLPDRRRDHRLPAADRPPRGAGRAGRGVRQGAGPVARPGREPRFSEKLELDLSTVVPTIAGPKRPQDRIVLANAKQGSARRAQLRRRGRSDGYDEAVAESFPASDAPEPCRRQRHQRAARVRRGCARRHRPAVQATTVTLADGTEFEIDHGAVTVAAITSCTNTSNPYVMVAAALVAKKAVEKGLTRKPWVKTTLAPGSKVVTDYFDKAGLTPYLDKVGFNLVGYGCTTCIGNSGPLIPEVARRSTSTTSRSPRCSPATATSRAGSTPTSR